MFTSCTQGRRQKLRFHPVLVYHAMLRMQSTLPLCVFQVLAQCEQLANLYIGTVEERQQAVSKLRHGDMELNSALEPLWLTLTSPHCNHGMHLPLVCHAGPEWWPCCSCLRCQLASEQTYEAKCKIRRFFMHAGISGIILQHDDDAKYGVPASMVMA
jgi:hypothetical protein